MKIRVLSCSSINQRLNTSSVQKLDRLNHKEPVQQINLVAKYSGGNMDRSSHQEQTDLERSRISTLLPKIEVRQNLVCTGPLPNAAGNAVNVKHLFFADVCELFFQGRGLCSEVCSSHERDNCPGVGGGPSMVHAPLPEEPREATQRRTAHLSRWEGGFPGQRAVAKHPDVARGQLKVRGRWRGRVLPDTELAVPLGGSLRRTFGSSSGAL